MKKYRIAIEETIVGEFEIEAEDSERAMEIAERKYNSEEFVLAPGGLCAKQMAIISPDDSITEWTEF